MDSPTLSSLLTAAAQVKYCVEQDRLSMVTIQPTYHITKVNFMHTLKQCSAITECLHGYTDLHFSVRYLTPTRCISYQCCSFRKKKHSLTAADQEAIVNQDYSKFILWLYDKHYSNGICIQSNLPFQKYFPGRSLRRFEQPHSQVPNQLTVTYSTETG